MTRTKGSPNLFSVGTWQEHLRDILIEAGTDGIGQRDLVKKLENVVLAADIQMELEFLLNQNPPKVQRFAVPTKGRTKTVWRATLHIMKE